MGKVNFSERKFEEIYTKVDKQKGTSCIWGNVYFGIIVFSCLLSTKPCLRFLLICFAREIKGFYQTSFGKEVNFRDIMNISPNILARNKNFKKLRHGFVDEKAQITTILKFSCNWKTFVSFACEKKDLKTHF